MKPNQKNLRYFVLMTGVAWSLFGCGGSTPDTNATAMDVPSNVASQYAEQLNRCFAGDVAARVIGVDERATLALGKSCTALPAMERRYGPPSFAVEHEELLRDPSMTGAEFTLVTVSDPSDDSERVNVTLRYFRSNGAPYEFTATLGLIG